MKTLQILMVDDDREWVGDFSENLEAVLPGRLQPIGWDSLHITHAFDQVDADRAVKDAPPDGFDMVLLDLHYPESPQAPLPTEPGIVFQGMRWLPQLRRLQPSAAIVILTSFPYEKRLEDVVKAIRDSHADEFVPKPASLDEIIGRLCISLDHARHVRQVRRLEAEFHRLLRSHAAVVLAADAGRLVDDASARFRRIAARIDTGDPAALETAPAEIVGECKALKGRFAEIFDFFDVVGMQRLAAVDLGGLARGMLDLYAWRFAQAGILPEPPAGPDVSVNTYDADIRIALHEVLSNAIEAVEATGKPSQDRKVSIRTEQKDNCAIIRVADTGGGFSKEIIADPFRPIRTSRKGPGHCGIGLYIANYMMHAIGGSLLADNRPEGGAEVTLMIPNLRKP